MPEPTEMQQFSHELKEATEQGGEPIKRISLAISILAVLVAMVTVLGHRAHTEAILMETRAGDQWGEYQAHKIRMDSLSVAIDLLATQPSSDTSAIRAKTGEYSTHIQKLKNDLVKEEEQALEFGREVNRAEARAARYDLGEALLQIAVVLSSITLFTRNKTYFIIGLLIGLAGLLVASSALFVH